MLYPEERVEKAVSLGPIEAIECLDRARAGDPLALADWTVRAAYRGLLKKRVPAKEAAQMTKLLFRQIDLTLGAKV